MTFRSSKWLQAILGSQNQWTQLNGLIIRIRWDQQGVELLQDLKRWISVFITNNKLISNQHQIIYSVFCQTLAQFLISQSSSSIHGSDRRPVTSGPPVGGTGSPLSGPEAEPGPIWGLTLQPLDQIRLCNTTKILVADKVSGTGHTWRTVTPSG